MIFNTLPVNCCIIASYINYRFSQRSINVHSHLKKTQVLSTEKKNNGKEKWRNKEKKRGGKINEKTRGYRVFPGK